MTTAALTLADFGGKFSAIQGFVTAEILTLINNSETMKGQIRAYEANTDVLAVVLGAKPGAASFTSPATNREGFATFGANTLSSTEKFLYVVSHELGHVGVEGPGSIVGNARQNAWEKRSENATEAVSQYDAACHLTEGYARLATAKVFDEIITNTNADDNFLIAATIGKMTSKPEYQQYKDLSPIVVFGQGTAQEKENTLAYALGESNKKNTTTTDLTEYVEFCRNAANKVIFDGSAPPGEPSPGPTELFFNPESDTAGVLQVDGTGKVLNSFTENGPNSQTFFYLPDSTILEVVTPGDTGGQSTTWTANFNPNVATTATNIVNGNGSADVLYASVAGDQVNGFAGNDALDGGAGGDVINGGDGNDLIGGGEGTRSRLSFSKCYKLRSKQMPFHETKSANCFKNKQRNSNHTQNGFYCLKLNQHSKRVSKHQFEQAICAACSQTKMCISRLGA